MTIKLPRATIQELEGMVEQLTKNDPKKREAAMIRLTDYERSGKIPVEVLIDISEAEHPPLSMYAISALGRNGGDAAVKQLIKLLGKNREGHLLFLETIVDAMGESKNHKAGSPLLEILGLREGLVNRLLGRRGKKENGEDEDPKQAHLREQMTLPVVRALEKIADPKAAEKLGGFLDHADPIIRWHIIQNILNCELTGFKQRLKEMAKNDASELVREAADIATGRLEPLPPSLNN